VIIAMVMMDRSDHYDGGVIIVMVMVEWSDHYDGDDEVK